MRQNVNNLHSVNRIWKTAVAAMLVHCQQPTETNCWLACRACAPGRWLHHVSFRMQGMLRSRVEGNATSSGFHPCQFCRIRLGQAYFAFGLGPKAITPAYFAKYTRGLGMATSERMHLHVGSALIALEFAGVR